MSLPMWRGAFGDEYTERNKETLAGREWLWQEILSALRLERPRSILEIGANIGLNLDVLSTLTSAELIALEPNDKARAQIRHRVIDGCAQSIDMAEESVDMVFTCGVLIHIPPQDLERVYDEIYRVAKRYVLSIEYFSPYPEMKLYQGHENMLFTRDFGILWMDCFPSLKLIDYGFAWKRATRLDNLTWWLFAKGDKP